LFATIPEVGVDDLGFLRAILATLDTEYNIDASRVYATGNSNGAFFAQRVACEMADVVAAVASVSGTMPDALAGSCQPARPISMMLIHGTDDYVVPFNGQPGRFLGVPATFDLWRHIDGCTENFISAQMADRADDGMRVQQIIANECAEGTEVVLIAVHGGGHAWPGGSYIDRMTTQDIDASAAMWQFFQAHPLP
jgi:polyhydroxybutyrate depolymerase